MTDNEIIKALECCKNDDCDNCPNTFGNCYSNLASAALNLIRRQQEEIDLLKMDNERMTTKVFEMAMKKVLKEKVRAEAIKEFAGKVENKLGIPFMVNNQVVGIVLDETIKEMAGAVNERNIIQRQTKR